MGRAIDMEGDIDTLKSRLNKIDAALEKVINVVDELQTKGTSTKPVDLVEDVGEKNDSKKQHKGKTNKESAKESV